MSLALRTSYSVPRREHGRGRRSLTGLWTALRGTLRRIERTAALRREIERMDDHMLSDLGVSRAQLEFEADRYHRHPRA